MVAANDFDDRDSGYSKSGTVIVNRYRFDALLLAALTFVSYLTLSWQFAGPTYLMDEIGYLTNAAALSGRTIDAGSSYYFGYSLFLLPSFLLFSEPTTIWRAVLVTNAAMFAAIMFLLHRLSGLLTVDRQLRFVAVCLCALYPAYPTMAGHAFSTPGVALVYVASCWALCQSVSTPGKSLLSFTLLVGFLTWVHPTGLPVAVAAVVTLGLMSWLDRTLVPVIVAGVAVMALMVLAYLQILQPMLLDTMTPEGFKPKLHYPSVADELAMLTSLGGVAHILTKYLGQIAYILIGSLALASGAAAHIIGRLAVVGRAGEQDHPARIGLLVFGLLSLLCMILMTSLTHNQTPIVWANHWFNGRHLEGLLLPFLLFSFLLSAPRLHRLIITLGVFALLILMQAVIRRETVDVNEIEVPAYWPQVLVPDGTILLWFLLGGVACTLAVFVPAKLLKFFLVGLYLLCIGNQIEWHRQSYWVNGRPSGLSQFLRDTTPVTGCIAFEPRQDRSRDIRRYERLNQLSYYLMGYNYRRMEIADWIENCDGPYLTYSDEPAFSGAGAVLIAQELETGLKVYTRETGNLPDRGTYTRVFVRTENEDGSISHIARVIAADLSGHLGVGQLVDGAIVTTDQSGHVFYGPYGHLKAGKYRFRAYGQASNAGESWFDVASDGGSRIHGTYPLSATGSGEEPLAIGAFAIVEDLDGFELRLNAGGRANIVFSHYDLEMLDR